MHRLAQIVRYVWLIDTGNRIADYIAMVETNRPIWYPLSGIAWAGLAYATLFLGWAQVKALTTEDGFFEIVGTVALLGVALVFFRLWWLDPHGNDFGFWKTRRNVVFLAMGAAFLFGVMEEISWGQRLFGVRTPEFLERINVQGELNVHNIAVFNRFTHDGQEKEGVKLLLNMERLFTVFCLAYGVIVPLMAEVSGRARRWLRGMGIPVLPLGVGLLFVVNYLVAKIIEIRFAHVLPVNAGDEIKECNASILFLIAAVSVFRYWPKRGVQRNASVVR